MITHKIFTGSLLLLFVLTVSLVTATLAAALIGDQPD
jgi:hypothetical protein